MHAAWQVWHHLAMAKARKCSGVAGGSNSPIMVSSTPATSNDERILDATLVPGEAGTACVVSLAATNAHDSFPFRVAVYVVEFDGNVREERCL